MSVKDQLSVVDEMNVGDRIRNNTLGGISPGNNTAHSVPTDTKLEKCDGNESDRLNNSDRQDNRDRRGNSDNIFKRTMSTLEIIRGDTLDRYPPNFKLCEIHKNAQKVKNLDQAKYEISKLDDNRYF
jgi:hypothetical protein